MIIIFSDFFAVWMGPVINLICTMAIILNGHLFRAEKKLLAGIEEQIEALSLKIESFEREVKELSLEFEQATTGQQQHSVKRGELSRNPDERVRGGELIGRCNQHIPVGVSFKRGTTNSSAYRDR